MNMNRKNLGLGLGKGYKNLIPRFDSQIHALSARGIKSPQRIYNFGGKYTPSIIATMEALITKYERLKDKSNLSPSEMIQLNEIEGKLEKVKPSKQLMNYVKKHKAVLLSAGAGFGLSVASMMGLKHTDPMSSGSLLAFPIGYITYEGGLETALVKSESKDLATKFPHIPESKRNELAFRLVHKRLYGGKIGESYYLIHKDGQYYKYDPKGGKKPYKGTYRRKIHNADALIEKLKKSKLADVKFKEGKVSLTFDGHKVTNKIKLNGKVGNIANWGHSLKDQRVFIDKDAPHKKQLAVHEAVEQYISEKYGLRYQEAHNIAEHFEKVYSDSQGINWQKSQDAILKTKR